MRCLFSLLARYGRYQNTPPPPVTAADAAGGGSGTTQQQQQQQKKEKKDQQKKPEVVVAKASPCVHCGLALPSRNALFRHLRDPTNPCGPEEEKQSEKPLLAQPTPQPQPTPQAQPPPQAQAQAHVPGATDKAMIQSQGGGNQNKRKSAPKEAGGGEAERAHRHKLAK